MNKKLYWKTLGFTLFCIVSIVAIVLLLFLGGGNKKLSESMDHKSHKERYNLLVMGTDGDETRADVMMICSVDKKNDSINVISIPRDTRVLINDSYYKLNAAIGLGGDELAIEKIKELTDIEVHDYVKFNFKAVEDVIDALGGIEFDVPQDMNYEDPYQDLYIHLKKGRQHLNGEQALQLMRFRQYPMGDLQRIKVQQDLIGELIKQKANIKYIFKAGSIYKAMSSNMETTLNAGDVSGLAIGLIGMNTENIKTFECPYYFSSNGVYVIIDKEKLAPIVEENFK